MLLAEPICALDHKADDFIGRIDHTQTVSSFLVIDLVEVLIDNLEKGLLLVVAADLGRSGANSSIVGIKAPQGALFQIADKEGFLKPVELLGDVVLMVKIVLAENFGEDFFRQNMLNEHFPHIGLG